MASMSEMALILLVVLFGWAIYDAAHFSEEARDKCKAQGMVVVQYDHNVYCANVTDLK